MDIQTIKAASAGGNILRFPDPVQAAGQKAAAADQQDSNFKRVLAAGDDFLGSHYQAGRGSLASTSNPEDNIYRTNRYRVALDDPLLYVMPGQNSGADGATSTSWQQPNVLSQQANDLYAKADLENHNQHKIAAQDSAAANSLFKGSGYESALESLKINHNANVQEASPELDLFLQRFALYNQRQQGQGQAQEHAPASQTLAQQQQASNQAPNPLPTTAPAALPAPLIAQAAAHTQAHARAQQAESAPLTGQILADQLRALQPQAQTPAPESASQSSLASAGNAPSDATSLAKEPQGAVQASQVAQASSPFSNSPSNANPSQGISLWARSDIPRYTGIAPAQPVPSIEGRIVRG